MIKQALKLECKRAFTSKGFALSLAIGCAIAAIQIAAEVIPLSLQLTNYTTLNLPMSYPGWLYCQWLGGEEMAFFSFLFYLILPVLAVLPHGTSFFADITGGAIHNYCIRTGKSAYFTAKYIATFLSGGLAVVIPLLLNFAGAAMFLPAMKPETAAFTSLIGEQSSFPFLYYNYPLLHVALFLLIIFLFSGLLASFALLCSFYVGYSFIVLMAPFAVYLFVSAFFSLVGLPSWRPDTFLKPSYEESSVIPILVESSVLLIGTLYGFVYKGSKEDMY